MFTALAVSITGTATIAQAADGAVCGRAVPYPGNSATPQAYANWMANGAVIRGLPAELPVMAALVESGLRNLNYGHADSVGFFQMRTSIWDKGEYKGYLKNPELQMKWFTDTAAKVRLQHVASGKVDPASSTATYGVWIADIERPAAEYRSRYQKRLLEAQNLVAATCPNLKAQDPNAFLVSVSIPSKQRSHRSARIIARLRCPNEPCNAEATAWIRVPGRRGLIRLHSDTMMLPAGKRGAVRIPIRKSLRARMRKVLRQRGKIRAKLRLKITDAAGGGTARSKRVRLVR